MMNAKEAEILFETTYDAIDTARKCFSLSILNPIEITVGISNKFIIKSELFDDISLALIYSPDGHHMIVYKGIPEWDDKQVTFKEASFI